MLNLLKFIMGMKVGYLLLGIGGIALVLSLIKNILTGSFNVAKFAGGFNIFTGSVQGKLIYYGLIIFGCFVVYSFIMRPTTSYDTDYRNNIHHNADVALDQRVGATCIPTKILWGVIQIGCNSQAMTKTVTTYIPSTEVKK